VEILPPALAAFQKANPEVKVLLHDMTADEIVDGLRNGRLQLAVTPRPVADHEPDVEFELLKAYPLCAVLPAGHALARLKTIPFEVFAAEPLVVLNRKNYPDAYAMLERLFRSLGAKPRWVVTVLACVARKMWHFLSGNALKNDRFRPSPPIFITL
jgi:DNA-binding transcriptional LysR family regulator